MDCRRQALQLCLDAAVVVVIQIFNEFLLELLYGFKFVHFNFLDGVYRSCRDYCLTTIVREVLKAGMASVFNGFREIQKRWIISPKTGELLKTQHFIRMGLKTPAAT